MVRDCYGTRHIRTKGRETLQCSQLFSWKSGHVEEDEEEEEFANLNEEEGRRAETGDQDEGKAQKNRMEGRSEDKAGGNTKGGETGRAPHFQSISIHMLSAGCQEPPGMGGMQRASSSSSCCHRITPHCCCEQPSSHGDANLALRIGGCQLQMNHSLHLPNRICPKTE